MTPTHLPLLPDAIRKAHHTECRMDTRYRANARLLQALWRTRQDLPIGKYVSEDGAGRRLGSRITQAAAALGGNFLTREIHALVRRELAYREPGALIDIGRLYSNLLASTPLVFNLFGPMKDDRALARRIVARLCPDFMKEVSHVAFEHSPGRGDPAFTADGTAFDVFIAGRAVDGGKVFVAIEVKYAEGGNEPDARLRPRYDDLSRASGLYIDPDDKALRRAPHQQSWRQHMLAQAMVDVGLYDAGRVMVIAPKDNTDVQRAARKYAKRLLDDPSRVQFSTVPLEAAIDAYRTAGRSDHATALAARYTDFAPVHELVAGVCNDVPGRPPQPPSPSQSGLARSKTRSSAGGAGSEVSTSPQR